MKIFIQPKRPNEYTDTARMKKVKITAQNFISQKSTGIVCDGCKMPNAKHEIQGLKLCSHCVVYAMSLKKQEVK